MTCALPCCLTPSLRQIAMTALLGGLVLARVLDALGPAAEANTCWQAALPALLMLHPAAPLLTCSCRVLSVQPLRAPRLGAQAALHPAAVCLD